MATKDAKNDNSEYKDLVDFLSVKFDNIDAKFEEVNEKLDRKPDREEVRSMIREDLVPVRAEIERAVNRIARVSDKIDDYRAIQSSLKRQVDLHDKKLASI